MSSEDLHAPRDRLLTATLTHHQAVVSLGEELEAADWYRQRADDCDDPALKDILLHNMREEIEHACMLLEWLRRNVSDWARQMDTYLYSDGAITGVEAAATGQPAAPASSPSRVVAGTVNRFTVGSLKGRGE